MYVLLGAAAGAAALAVILAVALWATRGRREPAAGAVLAGGAATDGTAAAALPAGAADVLEVLAATTIVVDRSDRVVSATASAEAYGLVRHDRLGHQAIRALVREVRSDGQIREDTLLIGRGSSGVPGDEPLVMAARVAPLPPQHVLVLVQDRTREQRLEQVRRDFVANISHELKTPVGGLSLLSEAVLEARDDPQAVERFASRMQVEAKRLTRLVADIVDLTRLQVADSLHEPKPVDLGVAVREAVDASMVLAEAKDIVLQSVVEPDLLIYGDEDLLVTAVRNLVTNAITYSDEGTRVAVRAHRRDGGLEVVVADHGHGIAPGAQERIFERFFRVDPARSRATGGTGLGLSIVKHVSAIHGGSVSVWSQEGRGSTFTIRLPLPPEATPDTTDEAPDETTDQTPSAVHPAADAREGAVHP